MNEIFEHSWMKKMSKEYNLEINQYIFEEKKNKE